MPPFDPNMLAGLLQQQGGAPAPGMGAPPNGGAPAPPAGGMGAMGDPGMAPPPGPSGQGAPAASPADQAIWATFPSTDPNVMTQMVQGAGQGMQGIIGLLPAIEQMQMADRQAFEQRQMGTLHALLEQLGAPPQGQAQQAPGPGVGGELVGY